MRVLMLILASDGGPGDIYTRLQENWRRYMGTRPDAIEAYFYKANPKLVEPFRIEGDTVWVRCAEGLPYVAQKLKLALQAFEARLDEFDYVCRPNLSSFWIFDRYLAALEGKPREGCCMGVQNDRPVVPFPSGAGFTLSTDIVRAILAQPFQAPVHGGDDVAVGVVLKGLGIKITRMPRMDIVVPRSWPSVETLPAKPEVFHVRVKHDRDRLVNDMKIFDKLLDMFYPKKEQDGATAPDAPAAD